jgi:hypothetical protein
MVIPGAMSSTATDKESLTPLMSTFTLEALMLSFLALLKLGFFLSTSKVYSMGYDRDDFMLSRF